MLSPSQYDFGEGDRGRTGVVGLPVSYQLIELWLGSKIDQRSRGSKLIGARIIYHDPDVVAHFLLSYQQQRRHRGGPDESRRDSVVYIEWSLEHTPFLTLLILLDSMESDF